MGFVVDQMTVEKDLCTNKITGKMMENAQRETSFTCQYGSKVKENRIGEDAVLSRDEKLWTYFKGVT